MKRSQMESIIQKELNLLDEGWLDSWRKLFPKKKKDDEEPEDLDPQKFSSGQQTTGPFAGRTRSSLSAEERKQNGCYKRLVRHSDYTDAAARSKCGIVAQQAQEPEPEPGPDPGPDPTPSVDQAGDVGDTIPISGTELTIIQQIAKKRGNDIFAVVRQTIEDLGAAQRHPEVGPIIKAFKGDFFKKLKDLNKRTNIAVAESLDEQDEKMTKRQRAAMKGRLRGGRGAKKGSAGSGGAAYAYVKGQGGKAPMLVRKLQANLEKAFMNPSEEEIFDAASEAGATIKDPKEKKKYEDSILKQLEKDPQKRISIYNENAAELVKVIAKMASDSLTKVVPQKERRKLPEGLQEKILKAITEALLKNKKRE